VPEVLTTTALLLTLSVVVIHVDLPRSSWVAAGWDTIFGTMLGTVLGTVIRWQTGVGQRWKGFRGGEWVAQRRAGRRRRRRRRRGATWTTLWW
jgi:hypothetical protein